MSGKVLYLAILFVFGGQIPNSAVLGHSWLSSRPDSAEFGAESENFCSARKFSKNSEQTEKFGEVRRKT